MSGVDPAECTIAFEAAGTRLDVNAASEEMLQRLFAGLGYAADADLAAALADWRDSDDVAHPAGAERDWYAAARRELPRNGPLADIRELARVRGFENLPPFEAVLTAEPGRVSLATAPTSVLMAVPGFTPETADRIVALQDAATPVTDVTSLLGLVSRVSADSMLAHFPEIARVTTPDPDAWILTVRASVGIPQVSVTLSRRILRAGKACCRGEQPERAVRRVGILVSSAAVRALVLQSGRVTWHGHSEIGEKERVAEALERVLSKLPRARVGRTTVRMAIGLAHSDVKRIDGLPRARHPKILNRLVRENADAFFLRLGARTVVADVELRPDGSTWAAAFDDTLVDEALGTLRRRRARSGRRDVLRQRCLPCSPVGNLVRSGARPRAGAHYHRRGRHRGLSAEGRPRTAYRRPGALHSMCWA